MKRGATRLLVIGALGALAAVALRQVVRYHTRNINTEHGDQVAVFTVVLLSFISPLLTPLIHLKMVLLSDILPHWVEGWVVQVGGNYLLTPSSAFDEISPPLQPNYANASFWSMLPGRGDTSEAVPPGARSCQSAGTCDLADAFYLHPTTWYTSASWNAPAIHPVTAYLSDDAIGPQQANAFNIIGRVFAPRYRQMSAGAFLQQGGFEHTDSKKALELAYADVKAAFEHYLDHHWDGKRGIILAGHSQGSLLAEKLLLDFFDGKPLHKHLVAAYLPGWTIFDANYASTPTPGRVTVCEKPSSVGCVISWRTFAHGGDPTAFLHVEPPVPGAHRVCVNPLSWVNGGGHVPHEQNLGGLDLMHPWTMMNYLFGEPLSHRRVQLPQLTANVSDAECKDGNLFISPLPRLGLGWYVWPIWHFAAFPGLNYHTYDLNLFFNNIRENVAQRVLAFHAKTKSAT